MELLFQKKDPLTQAANPIYKATVQTTTDPSTLQRIRKAPSNTVSTSTPKNHEVDHTHNE